MILPAGLPVRTVRVAHSSSPSPVRSPSDTIRWKNSCQFIFKFVNGKCILAIFLYENNPNWVNCVGHDYRLTEVHAFLCLCESGDWREHLQGDWSLKETVWKVNTIYKTSIILFQSHPPCAFVATSRTSGCFCPAWVIIFNIILSMVNVSRFLLSQNCG